MRSKLCVFIWFIVGVLLLVAGILLATFLLELLIRRAIQDQLIMKEDLLDMKEWMEPSLGYNITKQVYVFNITNPRDVLIKGTVPQLEEIGPFGYQVKVWKSNVTFSEDGNNVSIVNHIQFHYNQSYSCPNCSENSLLTVPNIFFFTIVNNLHGQSEYIREKIGELLWYRRAQPFVTIPAGDLLFYGYKDAVLKLAQEPLLSGVVGDKVPEKLSLFHGLNDSYDGVYTVDTGKRDISMKGIALEWNAKEKLPKNWWNSDYARSIDGTDGGQYPPGTTSKSDLRFFTSRLFRTYDLQFDKELEYKNQFSVLRFILSPQSLSWSKRNMSGFCNLNSMIPRYYPNQTENCYPDGIMDISQCNEGKSPVSLSFPHFLYGEEQLRSPFLQLQPNQEHHQSFFDIEPNTGLALKLSVRTQVNMGIIQDKKFQILRRIPTLMLPVFWVNQTAEIGDDLREMLEGQLRLIPISYYVAYAVAGLGLLICIICIITCIILARTAKAKKKRWTIASDLYEVKPLNSPT